MAYLEITRSGTMGLIPTVATAASDHSHQRGGVERANLDGGPASVGRHVHNLIVLNDQDVSRHHCIIDQEGSAFTLRDLESHNGTRVNGAILEEPTRLHDGDIITVGQTVMKFIDRSVWKRVIGDRT